jgi:formylglycine-generating enzyme required for sulfatase activity
MVEMNRPDGKPHTSGVEPYSFSEETDLAAIPVNPTADQKLNELAWRLRHRRLPMAPRQVRDEARPRYQKPSETSPLQQRGSPSAARSSRLGRRGILGIGAVFVFLGIASFAFTIDALSGGQWRSALLHRFDRFLLAGPEKPGASVAYLDPSGAVPPFPAGKEQESDKPLQVMKPSDFSEPTIQPVNPTPPSPQQDESSTIVGTQPQPAKLVPFVTEPEPAAIEPEAAAIETEASRIERATEEPAGGAKDAAQAPDRNVEEQAATTEMSSEESENAANSETTIATALTGEPAEPQNGTSFRDCAVCPEMVAIPAGRFMMGTSTADGAQPNSDESPQHEVVIAKLFALGRFEITFADWKACVVDGGCSTKPSAKGPKRERQPATKISWDDIKEQYLPWLSHKTGHTYRLPTEAEWEYAARGGPSAPVGLKFAFGNDASRICEYGNLADLSASDAPEGWILSPCKDGFAETAPVGSLKPNAMNLYDMHGNVWEWVEDCWNGNYQNAPSDGSAWTEGDCSLRVVRGGSWATDVSGLRSADRGWNRPNAGSSSIGFRVARPLE